jgi:SAM-dependent methyltransferase
MEAGTSDIKFGDEFLEDSRKFMLTDRQLRFLFQFLNLSPKQAIADLGCGTGFFTRQMARYVGGRGKIVGIDLDANLIRTARRICRIEQISIIEYVEGDATNLSLGTNIFDLTTCYFLLSRMQGEQPYTALDEMIRATKDGGQIMAFEPSLGAISALYPGVPKLSGLLPRIRFAKSSIQKDLLNVDENIGERLYQIFIEKGLVDVQLEIFAALWFSHLPFYLAELTDELKSWYIRRLRSLETPDDEQILKTFGYVGKAGLALRMNSDENNNSIVELYEKYGISKNELIECNQLRINFLKAVIDGQVPDNFVNGVEIMPVFAVKGQKPSR